MREYADLLDLKATLSLMGESFADPDLEMALTAASRAIDKLTSRRFWPDEDALSVRFYSATVGDILPIDDLIALTEVATDRAGDGTFSTVWDDLTDLYLTPLNAAADGEPYTAIMSATSGPNRFPLAGRAVRVTGQFGWAEVPAPISQATGILASKLMRRAREAPFGVVTVGVDEVSAFRIARTDPDVAFLAGPYRRGNLAVIA